MRKKLLFIILILIQGDLFAQINRSIDEMTIASPEATSFEKYGNYNVSSYIGIPDIEVPIYDFNFNGMKIPLKLSYYAGGIQVSQEASWVGLGWSLSATPVIQHQIHGLSDFVYDTSSNPGLIGYIYTDEELPEYQTLNSSLVNEIEDHIANYADLNIGSGRLGWDTEPDMFSVNLFGESAKFILTQKELNGGIIGVKLLNPDSRLEITYDENEQSFTVINDKGFQFVFDTKEYSVTASGSSNSSEVDAAKSSNLELIPGFDRRVISAWYLDKIISLNNDTLYFLYGTDRAQTADQPHYSDTRVMKASSEGESVPDGEKNLYFASITGHDLAYPKQIYSNRMSISFITSLRSDIMKADAPPYYANFNSILVGMTSEYAQKLDQIVIKNSLGDTIKNVRLNYSYFDISHKDDYLPKEYLRLKLDSIEVNNQFYRSFGYLNEDQLPDKLSKSADFWGFYNGKDNSTRVPSYKGVSDINSSYDLNFEGADRGADFEYGQNGLLSNIVYPTGGYTNFVYEANSICVNDSDEENNDYGFTEYGFIQNDDISIISNSSTYPQTESFSIAKSTNFSGTIYISCGSASDSRKTDIPFNDADKNSVVFELINTDTNATLQELKLSDIVTLPIDLADYTDNTYYGGIVNITEPGNYKIIVTGVKSISNLYDEDDGADQDDEDYGKQYSFSIGLKMSIPKLAIVDHYDQEIGGARIKGIINHDKDGGVISQTSYNYTKEIQGVNYSSGILMNPLAYHQYSSVYTIVRSTTAYNTNFFKLYSDSYIGDAGSANGRFIGYSQVKEQHENDGNTNTSGKTIFYYANEKNFFPRCNGAVYNFQSAATNSSYFPMSPPRYSYEEKNGDLLLQEVYDNNDNKLKTIRYQYAFHNYFPQRTIAYGGKLATAQNYIRFSDESLESITTYAYLYFPYYIKNEATPLIKIRETDFSGNDSIVSLSTNTYNDLYLITKSSRLNSREDSIIQETTYPEDINLGVYASMVEKNMLSYPVEQVTTKNNKVTAATLTTYKSGGGSYVPSEQYSLSTATPLTSFTSFDGSSMDSHYNTTPDVSYDQYNTTTGNVEQVTTKDGLTTSYLWDVTGQYPMAKVVNADYSTIDDLDNQDADYDSKILYASLKSLVSSTSLINTYSYKPLVGMTSSTGPNGVTTYYEYDDFNRLQNIRDDDDSITNRYYYHYYNETTADEPTLSLNKTSMSFTSSAGSSTFTISSNCTWSVSDNASWLTVSPGSGSGNGTITVTASANSSSARSATITITYSNNKTQSVLVTQAAFIATLTVSPSSLTFPYIYSTSTITISSNTTWTISSSVSWMTLSSGSGSGNKTITVTCSKSSSATTSRSGVLTITGGNKTVTVSVVQSGTQIAL